MLPCRPLGILAILAVTATWSGLGARAIEPENEHAGGKMLLGSPGEKAHVSLFGVKAEGSKFVYVLDRSGSTDGKLLAAAKAEILASIEKIDDVHQFQLVVYNERPKAFNPAGPNGQLAFGNDANRAEVKKFLSSFEADGGTDHMAALSMAIRMRPDVIFLLTDGDKPLVGARELDRIDRIGPGIIIHTIQFGEGPHRDAHGWMGKLAHQSGGEYRYVDTTKLEAELK
ncbi:MAG: VWA domain-containing protein [Thermoguttaceae bacterium]